MKILPLTIASLLLITTLPASAWWNFNEESNVLFNQWQGRQNTADAQFVFDFDFKIQVKKHLNVKQNTLYYNSYVVPIYNSTGYKN